MALDRDRLVASQNQIVEHSDGRRQLLRWWEPEGSGRASVVLVHGYAEHSGRYERVGGMLAQAGHAVYSTDLRGHGASSGERASVADVTLLVQDAEVALEQASARQAGSPLFILGHSMGGLVATQLALTTSLPLAGLILSGPAVGDPAGLELSLTMDPLPEVAIPSDALSRDPEVGRRYDEDPLNYRGPFRRETLTALGRGARLVRDRAVNLSLPLLILHGADDPLVSPQGSEDLYRIAASADKSLTVYPGLRHEILNEPEGPEIVGTILDWIATRIPRSG